MSIYNGIYFKSSFIEDQTTFNSSFLFYDQLNIVSPMDIKTEANTYFKNVKVPYQINHFGKEDAEYLQSVEYLRKTIDFAIKYQPLIGNGIVYQDHVLNRQINKMVNSLMSTGKISVDELINFVYGKDDVGEAYNEIQKHLGGICKEYDLKVKATAYSLSKKEQMELISDDNDDIIPIFDRSNINVKQLTSILSQNCFTVLMPKIENITNPEELLEIKEYLKDVLVPYRMALQRLSSTLRNSIKNDKINNIELSNEAKFIIESQIEPMVYEMQRKVEQSQNKLIIKIFGKVIGWIPVVATVFLAPTPDKLFSTLSKAYTDIGSLAGDVFESTLSKDPGLSYIISANKKMDLLIKK